MIIQQDGEIFPVDSPPLFLNLPHDQKIEAILILREDFNLTWRAISERMGMSEGAIVNLLNKHI